MDRGQKDGSALTTHNEPRTTHTLSRALALALTYVVSPLALPAVTLGVGARALGAGTGEVATVVALAVALGGGVPLAGLVGMVRRGEARTLEVRERTRRTRPYLLGALATGALALALAVVLPPPRAVLAWATALQAANALVLLGFNQRSKISVHLTALAGGWGVLVWLRLGAGAAVPVPVLVALAALVPALAWARVHLGAHTPGQVAAGTAFGLVVVPLELLLTVR